MQTVKSGMMVTASLVLSMLLAQGCGGDDKGAQASATGGAGGTGGTGSTPTATQVKDACVRICQKEIACDPPPIALDCTAACNDNSSGMGVPAKCQTNDVLIKINACLNGTCAALEDCLSVATGGCDSGSGTGGTGSGTGGATGTGGAGSGDCSVCAKANACCVALAAQQGEPASSCDSLTAAMCTSAGTAQSVTIMACQAILMTGVSLNIAACK